MEMCNRFPPTANTVQPIYPLYCYTHRESSLSLSLFAFHVEMVLTQNVNGFELE